MTDFLVARAKCGGPSPAAQDDGVCGRWRIAWTILVTYCLMLFAGLAEAQGLRGVLPGTGASAVVLDVASGRVVESYDDAGVRELPGSTLKPMVLLAALRSGVVNERTAVHCTGTLRVSGHNLACAHPRDITVLDARQALAESCNTYFAMVAQRLPAEALVSALRSFGVMPGRVPVTADGRVLLALGLEGASVSPQQLAGAYRTLALAMNSGTDTQARVVRDGMVQSVQTGMAHAAHVDGVALAGKTGTVDEAGGRSHGWFAGVVLDAAGKAQRVLVVFVPAGNGNDAAMLARKVLLRSALVRPALVRPAGQGKGVR